MDLTLAQVLAKEQADRAKKEAEEIEREAREDRARVEWQNSWHEWSDVWDSAILSRRGKLDGVVDEHDVARVLSNIVRLIDERGLSANLDAASNAFEPSLYDDEHDRQSGLSVKVLIQMLVEVKAGKEATAVARRVLSLEPPPNLGRADLARYLIRIANIWPVHCDTCGCIQPPSTFDRARCAACRNKQRNEYTMHDACNISATSLGDAGPPEVRDAVRTINARIQSLAVDLNLCEPSAKRWDAAKCLLDWLVGQTGEPYSEVEQYPAVTAFAKASLAAANKAKKKSVMRSSPAVFSVDALRAMGFATAESEQRDHEAVAPIHNKMEANDLASLMKERVLSPVNDVTSASQGAVADSETRKELFDDAVSGYGKRDWKKNATQHLGNKAWRVREGKQKGEVFDAGLPTERGWCNVRGNRKVLFRKNEDGAWVSLTASHNRKLEKFFCGFVRVEMGDPASHIAE